MTTTAEEQEIFAALRFKVDAEPSERVTISGYKHEAIHRAISNGIAADKISFTPIINPYLFGIVRYSIFFSLSSKGREQREQVCATISQANFISWGCNVGGEYDLGITIAGTSPSIVQAAIERLNGESGQIFQERIIHTQVRLFLFPLRFFSKKVNNQPPLEIGPRTGTVSLSEFQRRLIYWLTKNGYSSLKELSRGVGASMEEVRSELGLLRKNGAFPAVCLIPKVEKFGFQPFFLFVYIKNIAPGIREKMLKFCAETPQVDRLIECLGSWDFEVGVVVKDESETAPIVAQLIEALGREYIGHVRIMPRYQELIVNWLPKLSA